MNTKLDNITTQYRKFNVNQALTEGQLNEFIDYFEDQDRLTRTRLNGVGNVCGFKSKFFYQKFAIDGFTSGQLKVLQITQGAGVTTDGDLITLRQNGVTAKELSINFESINYTHYRKYVDVLKYPHFSKDGKQMPFLELLTYEEAKPLLLTTKNIIHPVSNLGLENKIIILYLESYSNEESPCQDADCNNQGAEQVSNLKVLLADAEDVEAYMVNGDVKDSIYNLHNRYEVLYDALPNIEASRVILNTSITTEIQLNTEFLNAILTGGTVSKLITGFEAIAKTFNVNPGKSSEKLNSLLKLSATNIDNHQYRYDFVKDLIDTYNEIKGLVLHLKAECCPDIASFPKHLMLGAVGAPLALGDHTPYRHDFYNSPINTNDDENYERLILLANRFVQKIEGFQSVNGPIKITPSNINVTLGKKAIPYYYNVTKNFLEKWNFEKTQVGKERYNLSYHTINLASDSFVQNPLKFNIDDNDFYRIEGHLGMPYKAALQNINDLKVQYGLAFDVITLVLQKGKAVISKTLGSTSESTIISIQELRDQLVAISSDISNQAGDPQTTLQTISNLDSQLSLLNTVEYTSSAGSENTGVSVLTQNPKKGDVVSELLSEFLERKSGLEHVAGVEPGGTFVLIYKSETDNKVIADFALPYLCCSKKDPVFMVLSTNKLCQDDKAIPMTILPLDGEVKAFVNGNTQIPVITQLGGQNMFNPSLVPDLHLGETITFTVNDDSVDAQMVVYEEPNVVVMTGKVTNGENATNPTAKVDFIVSGNNLSGLKYSWSFGDGETIEINAPTPINGIVTQSHIYNLTAGKEETFNPTLTVINNNSCSKQYTVTPLKLTGQSIVQCLSSMDIIVQYNQTLGPCPGGHTCNNAKFNLMANGTVNLGLVNLNNAGALQTDQLRPNGETSGPNRISTISITPGQAQDIANTDPNNNGFISFSLVCASSSCHSGVAWTTIKLGGQVIYNGCPTNNFLTINPCTGEIKP
jgi:hypothetical protein